MPNISTYRGIATIALAAIALAACNPLTTGGRALEYASGQDYTEEDYKNLANQLAQDTAFNLLPGGSVFQFATNMPEGTRNTLMETFRHKRNAAEAGAIYAHGLESRALDAEADYYDNYINCLAGSRAACDRVPDTRAAVRAARAHHQAAQSAQSGGNGGGGGHSH